MKFRCPYCRAVFGPPARSHCPACGKVMGVPGRFRTGPEADALKAARRKAKAERRARERAKGAALADRWGRVTRSPRYLAVLVVLFVVLGAILVSNTSRPKATPRVLNHVARCEESLATLRLALDMFRKDCGRYPTPEETLSALIRRPRAAIGWNGPYIKVLWPDPWQGAYCYAVTHGTVVLFSRGPDGTPGTADDIHAPPPDMSLLSPAEPATSGNPKEPPAAYEVDVTTGP
jgi:general secretion pathway protein G